MTFVGYDPPAEARSSSLMGRVISRMTRFVTAMTTDAIGHRGDGVLIGETRLVIFGDDGRNEGQDVPVRQQGARHRAEDVVIGETPLTRRSAGSPP
jgi:hypothetical protein